MRKLLARPGSGLFILFLLLTLLPANLALALPDEDYATLRKFLSARMYGEAYFELIRMEMAKDEFDPKLEKLRKDLLERTRERLTKQARVSPDDPTIFTILADISFHEGKLEEASKHATRALQNKSGPTANYVFAKVLFRNGNLAQAFDQMATVLESMPDSPVVFEDFQFLYSCKSYGIATARKLSKNSNFIRRATPVAGDANLPKVPESPFENDPTAVSTAMLAQTVTEPDNTTAADYGTSDEPDDDGPLPDESGDHDDSDVDDHIINETPDDDEPTDTDIVDRPVPEPRPIAIATPARDPEIERIEKAEYWLKQAVAQYENRSYDDAKNNLDRAVEIYPEVPGKDEIRDRLGKKFELFKRYREAKDLFELEKFDQAIPTLIEAYKEEPERFKEAPFYIGKSYILRDDPDLVKALEYLDIVLKTPGLEPLFRRDIEWTRLELLYALEKYEQADAIFQNFRSKEEAFAKNQPNFTSLRIGIFYHRNELMVHIGLGVFALLFLIVFMLQLVPAISLSFSDPLKSARYAFETKKYDKAVSITEKALLKKQPIQIERELLEILVKTHFELKNYVRCQENARLLLEKFPTNNVAWGFLAKSSIACNDTSSEAIAMYETIYKDNPGKTEYLPILARHYAKTKTYTVEAMGILFTSYQTGSREPEIIMALAKGYAKNRSMGNEVIVVLEEALKIQDLVEFRELLARNYSKASRFSDAARECIKVLNENINNMGIHVVYTSSMKKLKMVDEAVTQYREFMQRFPGNEQLSEIFSGLKKDATAFSGSADDNFMPEIPDELPMPDLPDIHGSTGLAASEIDIENFVEPPPEGFEMDESTDIPMPDFLKDALQTADNDLPPAPARHGVSGKTADLPTLDPFADNDSFLNELVDELPEELGGPSDIESVDRFVTKNMVSEEDLLAGQPPEPPPMATEPVSPPPAPGKPAAKSSSNASIQHNIALAREKAQRNKWDEVIEILSPDFASNRDKDTGVLLANALLQKNSPIMAMEILDTLDFDPEIMTENIKSILYRTGVALEAAKKYPEALKMYDTICNVDINYKDAFDRSDKLYSRKQD
jgi:tetratricopeptide (TPR) repeat protein